MANGYMISVGFSRRDVVAPAYAYVDSIEMHMYKRKIPESAIDGRTSCLADPEKGGFSAYLKYVIEITGYGMKKSGKSVSSKSGIKKVFDGDSVTIYFAPKVSITAKINEIVDTFGLILVNEDAYTKDWKDANRMDYESGKSGVSLSEYRKQKRPA